MARFLVANPLNSTFMRHTIIEMIELAAVAQVQGFLYPRGILVRLSE